MCPLPPAVQLVHQRAELADAARDLALPALRRVALEGGGRVEHVLAGEVLPHAARDQPALPRAIEPVLALRHETGGRREFGRGREHAPLTASPKFSSAARR